MNCHQTRFSQYWHCRVQGNKLSSDRKPYSVSADALICLFAYSLIHRQQATPPKQKNMRLLLILLLVLPFVFADKKNSWRLGSLCDKSKGKHLVPDSMLCSVLTTSRRFMLLQG